MKTFTLESRPVTNNEFPKLMVNSKHPVKPGQVVILAAGLAPAKEGFPDYLIGTVVHTESLRYQPGYYTKMWTAAYFTDFGGVIQLENDA